MLTQIENYHELTFFSSFNFIVFTFGDTHDDDHNSSKRKCRSLTVQNENIQFRVNQITSVNQVKPEKQNRMIGTSCIPPVTYLAIFCYLALVNP